jgi:hypothetical protein
MDMKSAYIFFSQDNNNNTQLTLKLVSQKIVVFATLFLPISLSVNWLLLS